MVRKRDDRRGVTEPEPLMRSEPKPPFPEQHQPKPGLESKMEPRPHYQAERYKPAGKLEGKVALVTGGDSGIGRAVCVLYAREGADVAFTYLPEEESDAQETRQAVEAQGGRCLLLAGHLEDRAFCEEVVERTADELGRLDILVSNAAHQNHKDTLDDITEDDWFKTFDVNIHAYFRLVKAAVPHMKPGSSIIVTTSVQGWDPSSSLPDYAATKGAINNFTRAAAKMLVDKGIRVNGVAPGPVWTPLNPADEGTTAQKIAHFGEKVPMGRPAQPEELAPFYVFLASDADSSYITGAIMPVMGGEANP